MNARAPADATATLQLSSSFDFQSVRNQPSQLSHNSFMPMPASTALQHHTMAASASLPLKETLFLAIVVFALLSTLVTVNLVAKDHRRQTTRSSSDPDLIVVSSLRSWKAVSRVKTTARRRIEVKQEAKQLEEDLRIPDFLLRTLSGDTAESRTESNKTTNTDGDTLKTTTPITCATVQELVQSGQWEDPNLGQLLARNIASHPSFAMAVHTKEYDRLRYSSIYIKGDYYEKKVRNRFLYILAEEASAEATSKVVKKTKDNSHNDDPPLVLDVGGNIGYYTLLSAAMHHQVVTFEINPANLIRVCESIQLNKDLPSSNGSVIDASALPNVTVAPYPLSPISLYRYAVSDTQGRTLQVDVPKRNPGEAHVVTEQHDGGGKMKEETMNMDLATLRHAHVTTVTLDDFARGRKWLDDSLSTTVPNISILKIDTEGHEPQIIAGAQKLLASGIVRNVLMEYRPGTCRPAIDVLLEAGYGVVYENMDRRIVTLLSKEFSITYLDAHRAGAASRSHGPRKGLSSFSSTTTHSQNGTTAIMTRLDVGYEDLWFRLLSHPLPPSISQTYWSTFG